MNEPRRSGTGESHTTALGGVIARIPALAGTHVATEAIGGGITNVNYRVEVDGVSFFVRVPGEESRLLGIDRRREYECTAAAAQSGVGPEVVDFLEAEGVLVTRFIAGHGMSLEEIRRPESIRRVAATLRRLHGGPPFPGTFSPMGAVADYLRISRQAAPLPAAIDSMVDQARAIDRALGAAPPVLRPCHNDLLLANFIDDGRQIWVVDWEYAAMGDPFFDLGNFAVHQGLSDEQEQAFLTAYLGGPTDSDLARLKLMKILSDLREAMWAMVQVSVSALDYDFVGYGQKHFDRYLRQLQDARVPRWLTDAARGT
ncbi:MAG TPA: phosphotransferase [bacterium]